MDKKIVYQQMYNDNDTPRKVVLNKRMHDLLHNGYWEISSRCEAEIYDYENKDSVTSLSMDRKIREMNRER